MYISYVSIWFQITIDYIYLYVYIYIEISITMGQVLGHQNHIEIQGLLSLNQIHVDFRLRF